jgi:hypothetical protein
MRKLLILADARIRGQRKWPPLTLDQHWTLQRAPREGPECAQRVGVGLTVKQHGVRDDDEQFAQVLVAHLRSAPELLLAA